MKHGSCDLNLLFVPDVRNVQVDISFQFMLRYETVNSFSFKRKKRILSLNLWHAIIILCSGEKFCINCLCYLWTLFLNFDLAHSAKGICYFSS